MKIMKVLVERWIVVDNRGVRISTWYPTPEGAQAKLDLLEGKVDGDAER